MISENWKNEAEAIIEYRQEPEGPVMAHIDLLKTEAGKIVIRHTEVDPVLEGQGIGKALLNYVFDYARKIEFKILPVCPFAKNVMYNNLDKYRELL